ncbi:class I SAM-dependent methyltransferase [Aquipuribacter hungaricus]|uniref:Class I SAM-dependent methyltransferase n=1 Tax=Aquipuribacter hungaricus TaxID=545624 RepID=A0ABV7WB81_9MICO
MTSQTHGQDHHGSGSTGTDGVQDVDAVVAEMMRQEFWDARYAGEGLAWSGDPNPQLVAEVADLEPGRALDVGCGEGGDAVWLARRGWDVTAADLSPLALVKVEAVAAAAGVGDRVRTLHLDAVAQAPEPAAYDLVSAAFLHLPPEPRAAAIAGLAAAVAPGGTLLWVAHSPLDLALPGHGPRPPQLMPTETEVAAALDPQAWSLEVVEARPRTRTGEDGTEVLHHDVVVRARRTG